MFYLSKKVVVRLKQLLAFLFLKVFKRFGLEDRNFSIKGFNFNKNKKLLGGFLLILLSTAAFIFFSKLPSKSNEKVSSEKLDVKEAKSVLEINREFTFPLRDNNGVDVGKVKYMIEKAELRDEIIVKGQRATAIKGRTFLILILKITNEFKQAVEIETRDYVRLSVNGNMDEWLAPDIHNDPVKTQAISTKYTRVGFPLSETDRGLVLRVGEIDGKKEEISFKFK